MDMIGIDLHKRESQLCISPDDGTVTSNGSSRAASGSRRCSGPGRPRAILARGEHRE